MKKDILEILVCPVCRGGLELNMEEEREGKVISGALHCSKCDVRYPIEDGIPNLLPPEHSG